jgi:hypothetical protein
MSRSWKSLPVRRMACFSTPRPKLRIPPAWPRKNARRTRLIDHRALLPYLGNGLMYWKNSNFCRTNTGRRGASCVHGLAHSAEAKAAALVLGLLTAEGVRMRKVYQRTATRRSSLAQNQVAGHFGPPAKLSTVHRKAGRCCRPFAWRNTSLHQPSGSKSPRPDRPVERC